MENKNPDSALLDIFREDRDRYDSDLSAMSNFFSVSIDCLRHDIKTKTAWDIMPPVEVDNVIGRLIPILKTGCDISGVNTLVADLDHFSEEIAHGLETGKYRIGQSKEISGNFRPAIVDKNNLIVKQITLKRAVNPAAIFSDISSLALQSSIQRITFMLDSIKLDVQDLTNFVRGESLRTPFLNARTKVIQASIASEKDQEIFLKEADTYLMEGYNSLFVDLDEQIKALSTLSLWKRSLPNVDRLLSFVREDMQLIPRYVGLQTYLFNYQGKFDETKRILHDYAYKLRQLNDQKIGNGKYTASELIHTYYPYDDKNKDFWLEEPRNMLTALDGYTSALENKNNDVLYIDVEDI